MKNMKLTILIIIILVMSGLFAGVKFFEYKVNTTIAEIIASSDMLAVESYSFNLPSRKLTIKNINYTIKDADVEGVYYYEEITAYLAWDLLLHDGSPGIIAVADNIVVKNSSATVEFPEEQVKVTLTVALATYDNLAQDVTSFIKILQNKDMAKSLITLTESTRCSFAKNENIVFTLEDPTVLKMSIKSTELRDYTGLQLGYFSINGVEASYSSAGEDLIPIFGFNILSISNLAIPSSFNELFKDININEIASANFDDELFKSFTNATTPILTNVTIKDAWANINSVPVKLNSYIFDWNSISPLQISINSELSFPTAKIEQEYGFAMPLIETMHINFNTTLQEDLQGKIQKTNVFEMKNLARLEVNISMITDNTDILTKDMASKDKKAKDAITKDMVANNTTTIASAYNLVANGKIENIDVKYTDNGLLSYILLNLDIKTSKDATALLVFAQMEFPTIKESTLMQISDFIHNPGSIEMYIKPEKPMTYDEFTLNIGQLPQYLTIKTSQGEKSLNESLDILFKE